MKTVTTRVTAFVFWLRRQDLNLQRPSCGSQSSLRLGAPMNFDRCATIALPSSATGGGRALCPGNPSVAGHTLKKYPPFGEYLKLVAETGFEPATSGL